MLCELLIDERRGDAYVRLAVKTAIAYRAQVPELQVLRRAIKIARHSPGRGRAQSRPHRSGEIVRRTVHRTVFRVMGDGLLRFLGRLSIVTVEEQQFADPLMDDGHVAVAHLLQHRHGLVPPTEQSPYVLQIVAQLRFLDFIAARRGPDVSSGGNHLAQCAVRDTAIARRFTGVIIFGHPRVSGESIAIGIVVSGVEYVSPFTSRLSGT